MDELDDFKDVDEDGFGGKSYDISFVFLHYYVAWVLPLEIEESVDAGPLCHGYIFPEPVVDLYHMIKAIWGVFDCDRMRISFGVAEENSSEFRTL